MPEFYSFALRLFDPEKLLLFVLVLSRVSGLMMIAPVYGTREVPVKVRALLTFALTVLISPLPLAGEVSQPPVAMIDFLVYVGAEVLIGYLLGMGVWLFFTGLQVAGQLIAQVGGQSAAGVLNPTLGSQTPMSAQLFYLFCLAVYLIIGGHRVLMAGLLETFRTLPVGLGSGWTELPLLETVTAMVSQSFELGFRIGAPVTVSLLVSTLVMGLISRTLPQLNIMVVGFGVNALVTMSVLCLSFSAVAWAFEDQLQLAFEVLLDAVDVAPAVGWLG